MRRPSWSENDDRVAFIDQRHRSMLHFRAGECLRLDAAHLLELECGFHRQGEAEPAADDEQAICVHQHVQRALPILLRRAL